MARRVHRLSARKVETLVTPGMHADGGGLYLRISAGRNAGKRWVFIYRRPSDKKRCEMGLGDHVAVPLAKARETAAAAKGQGFRTGENPAAWRGHLKLILPARPPLTRGHHARMSIDDVPGFMAEHGH